MKTVAVIEAGGRGSALIDAYAKSPEVSKLLFIPGNDLAQINTKKPVLTFPNLKTISKDEILKICREFKVSLIDVAQDNAIEAGVADLLRENGFKVVGASRDAGRLEWDKAWSREFMVKYDLPAPKFWVFKDAEKAERFLKSSNEQPFVIKAAGLAEGKGVIIAQNITQALSAVSEMSKFGASGETFLIEEFLEGEEFSSFAMSDGNTYQIIGNAQDHKRVNDGDEGPNTGGMGCSTPALILDGNIQSQIDGVFKKTFEGLRKENLIYQGILYLGGIVVKNKVFMIEFNSRWGDPEVECILPGFENDWFEIGMAVADGKLNQVQIRHDGKSRIAVAVASKGYPQDYSEVKGKEIIGLDRLIHTPGVKVYGAGVKRVAFKSHPEQREGSLVYTYTANGGRLFYVVTEGNDVIEAREKAYSALEKVSILGENGQNLLHYRKDIGYRDVKRLT